MKLIDIYNMAWSKPISQISKETGVSYPDFKKLCVDNNIPLPPIGYWSKLKHGKEVNKTALPSHLDIDMEIDLETLKKTKENRELKLKIIKPKKTHPLVVKTKKQLKLTESYRDSVVRMDWKIQKDILPIHTDKKLQKRALNFMNLFLTIMEERGMKIKFEYGRCNVELFDQTIEINLRQKYHRVRTLNERGWSSHDFVKSNKLEFQTGSYARKNWLDTEKIKIEERIPKILDYIEKHCAEWHECHKRNEILRKQRELELQKQQELERLQKIEEEKTAQLYADAENWQKAEILRNYMKTKKEDAIAKGTNNTEFKKWLEWVTTKINELDPLVN